MSRMLLMPYRIIVGLKFIMLVSDLNVEVTCFRETTPFYVTPKLSLTGSETPCNTMTFEARWMHIRIAMLPRKPINIGLAAPVTVRNRPRWHLAEVPLVEAFQVGTYQSCRSKNCTITALSSKYGLKYEGIFVVKQSSSVFSAPNLLYIIYISSSFMVHPPQPISSVPRGKQIFPLRAQCMDYRLVWSANFQFLKHTFQVPIFIIGK